MTDQVQSSPMQISGTLSERDQFLQHMATMQKVVQYMKEIPELPSEKPKDVTTLSHVEFPVDGGVLTYMVGREQPYRGFPFYEFVDQIDGIKKIARAILSGLYHKLKKRRWLLLTLIPALWMVRIFLSVAIYVFYRRVERFRLKRNIYCQPIRELYRAFSVERQNEDENTREMRQQLRDLVCMVLEFDNAYKYRMQDVIVEMNQQAIRKNVAGELLRLVTMMQEREKVQDVADTWTLAKWFIRVYFRIDRKFAQMVSDVLSQLDLKQMALSIEDQFYCKPREDYRFGFMTKQ